MVPSPAKEGLPIRVLVRIRPGRNDLSYTEQAVTIVNQRDQRVEYSFDRVFPPESKTTEIFDRILPEIRRRAVLSILAYGQTGSGKTFTMLGSNEQPGLVQLVVEELLREGAPIKTSFLEIYNEKAFDLFDDREKFVREADGRVCVQGLTELPVDSLGSFAELSQRAFRKRKTANTALNSRSSRSHMLIFFSSPSAKEITLVDLAGSENNRETQNQGIRMKESQSINRSLFVLNKVVQAIVRRETRVPYRDSKLTRLLSRSIGGTGSCFLIATLIDDTATLSEASHTLTFATATKKIENKASTGASLDNMICNRTHSVVSKIKRSVKGDHVARTDKETRLKEDAVDDASGKKKAGSVSASASAESLYTPVSLSFSSSSTGPLSERQSIEMTPITKRKSYECFIARAREYEEAQRYREALSTYRMIQKFAESEHVEERISSLRNLIKQAKKKLPAIRVLEILNTGNFFEIKQIRGIGDRRARAIVDFVVTGGNFFESLADLKMLFSERVCSRILEGVEE